MRGGSEDQPFKLAGWRDNTATQIYFQGHYDATTEKKSQPDYSTFQQLLDHEQAVGITERADGKD
jgi:hypothetical protein